MRIGIDLLAVRPGIGAGFVYPVELVTALAGTDADHEFFLFVSRSNREYFPVEDARFTFVECRVDNARVPLRVLYQHVALPRRIKAYGIDLLHSPSNIAPFRPGVPYVVTTHFLNVFTRPDQLPGRAVRYLASQMKRSATRADAVIAVSDAFANGLAKVLELDRARVATVPLGLAETFLEKAAAPPPSSQARREDLRLLTVTNPLPHKNNGVTVAAAARVAEALDRKVTLVVAGGWEADTSAPQVEVELKGHLTSPELAGLYAGSDALVMPTLEESFGLPVLEALACSCPVVCSDLPALREIGGEVPYYCDPRRPVAVADAVIRATEAQDTDRLASGRRRAQGYTWAATAEATLAVYEKVLEKL